jgi:acyl-phosphate glycerol 3-phosphate acyltransferase
MAATIQGILELRLLRIAFSTEKQTCIVLKRMLDQMLKFSVLKKQRNISFFRCAPLYVVAYLYGSLPLVYFLGRQSGADLKQSGSGNVGAANLLAVGGLNRAVIGLLFDVSKGCLPIVTCRRLGYSSEVAALAGVCGMVGQCWPIFLRFNGGRGISSFIGASFFINRKGGVISALPMIAGALWRILSSFEYSLCWSKSRLKRSRSKSVPFGCFLSILTFPLICYLDQRSKPKQHLAPVLLSFIILGRRLTAPLPDDTIYGPTQDRRALLYRLLYDRNTSC